MSFLSEIDDFEVDEIKLEIFRKYKYALEYIGVDFSREDVQEAIVGCNYGMESAFQATIVYWKTGKMQFPSAFIISALNENWSSNYWKEELLNDSNFKSPCTLWWEEAEVALGRDVRNSLIADVAENDQGYEYVLFTNGKTISLKLAKAWGWQRILEYAQGKD